VSAADRPLELLINGSLIQGKSGWEGGEPSVALVLLQCRYCAPPLPGHLILHSTVDTIHPLTKSIVGRGALLLDPRCAACCFSAHESW
jgi:hypothetical protein